MVLSVCCVWAVVVMKIMMDDPWRWHDLLYTRRDEFYDASRYYRPVAAYTQASLVMLRRNI